MNRQYFTESTKSLLIHLKQYNQKLCRKGLLVRVREMKISCNGSITVENAIVEKALQISTDVKIPKMMVTEISEMNLVDLDKEIGILNSRITSLDKTIVNIKTDVKSRIDDCIYNMWLNRINNIAGRWKKLYSDMNNDLYNHLCKVSKIHSDAWECIIRDICWIESNIFIKFDHISEMIDGFDEGDLKNLFSDEQDTNKLKRAYNADEHSNLSEKKFKAESSELQSINDMSSSKICKFISPVNEKSNLKSPIVKLNQLQTPLEKEKSNHLKTCKNEKPNPPESDHLKMPREEVFENISSDEDETIINNVLCEAEIDEIGQVDLIDFEDMIKKYLQ